MQKLYDGGGEEPPTEQTLKTGFTNTSVNLQIEYEIPINAKLMINNKPPDNLFPNDFPNQSKAYLYIMPMMPNPFSSDESLSE